MLVKGGPGLKPEMFHFNAHELTSLWEYKKLVVDERAIKVYYDGFDFVWETWLLGLIDDKPEAWETVSKSYI